MAAAAGLNEGVVVAVRGPVLDVRFPVSGAASTRGLGGGLGQAATAAGFGA